MKKKKQPKVYYVYTLAFKNGCRYYGSSGTEIGKRERQHRDKWEGEFEFVIHSSGYKKKSEALMTEVFLISQHWMLGDRTTLLNQFIGRFGF